MRGSSIFFMSRPHRGRHLVSGHLLLKVALLVSFALSARMTAAASDIPRRVPDYLAVHETDEPLVPSKPPVVRHDVLELKIRLRDLNYYSGPIDETYDPLCVSSVKEFQRKNWLDPTGIVDRNTWKALAAGIKAPVVRASGPVRQGEVSLLIDTEKLELTVLIDGQPWKTYPVAVGRWNSMTPVGEWKIVDKGYETGGAFGTRWMALDVPWGGYGIHGTNRPWSIGSYASLGCVRMFNEHIEEIFDMIPIGTRVKIVGVRPPLRLDRPLRLGSIGPEVVRLQEALREFGFDAGPLDGRYGPLTESRVRDVKSLFGLSWGGQTDADLYVLMGIGE